MDADTDADIIVERLGQVWIGDPDYELCQAAKAEITRLRAEVERVNKLLTVINERDIQYNLFNIPSGGWIREQITRSLGPLATDGKPK